MNDFYRLLNPERRENCTFVLTAAFKDDAGNPLEWELRQMNREEQSRLARSGADFAALLEMLAATLVRPKLDDAALLAALSLRCDQPVRTAAGALGMLLTWDELRRLQSLFEWHNGLDIPFSKRVAKLAGILEDGRDARARLVHLALQNHHIPPREYFALTEPEQAFLAASDLVCQEEMKKDAQQKSAVQIRRR